MNKHLKKWQLIKTRHSVLHGLLTQNQRQVQPDVENSSIVYKFDFISMSSSLINRMPETQKCNVIRSFDIH